MCQVAAVPFWSLPSLPRSLPAALRDLDETSPVVRASAARDLVRYHDAPERPAIVESLLRRLEDETPRVRAAAAETLGELADSAAVMRLLLAIEDDHPLVRQMAIQALGQIGDRRAAPRLHRALADARPDVRFQAVLAYPKLVREDAETVMLAATEDPDGDVRYVALRLLEERALARGDEALSPSVRATARARVFDDLPGVRVAAALLLAHGGDLTGAAVIVDVVAGTFDAKEPDDEAAAVEAAGRWELRDATSALVQRVYGPRRWLREQHSFLARISLAQLGDERARTEILRDLRAWSRSKRTLAVLAAGRARLHAARPLLTALMAAPEQVDPAAVAAALRALDGGDVRDVCKDLP